MPEPVCVPAPVLQETTMKNKSSAFTLLELLFVIFLISILATLAIPSFKNFLDKTKEETLLSQLLNAITLTRNSAITYNTKIKLCHSRNSQSCNGEWQQGFIAKLNEKIIYAFHSDALNGKLFFRAFPKGREDLEFLATGFANIENGTFWYCRDGNTNPQWAMMLNRVGRTRITYPGQLNEIRDDHNIKLNCP